MSQFRPQELSPSLAGGAPLAHQCRRMDTLEFAVDLSCDTAAMVAAGGGLLPVDVANDQPFRPMAPMASSPLMPSADADQGRKRGRTRQLEEPSSTTFKRLRERTIALVTMAPSGVVAYPLLHPPSDVEKYPVVSNARG